MEGGGTADGKPVPIEKSLVGNTMLEISPDIDVIAASSDDTDLSDKFKTVTKLKCNSAEIIGHNIKGEKPILIHVNHEQESEDYAILLLTVALKHIFLNRHDVKRLFFYHTEDQMAMWRKILTLLDMEHLLCSKQTKWKYERSDKTVVKNLAENDVYNLLTEIRSCRGAEFSESICAINVTDMKLRHITLEGMSRATNRLIIVSTRNINSALEDIHWSNYP